MQAVKLRISQGDVKEGTGFWYNDKMVSQGFCLQEPAGRISCRASKALAKPGRAVKPRVGHQRLESRSHKNRKQENP